MAESQMKLCKKCDTEKVAQDNFLWVKTRWHSWCNDCRKKERRDWYLKNLDHAKSYAVNYHAATYEDRKSQISAKVVKWQQENKDKYALKSKRWYENNRHKTFANCAKYRAAKRDACPKWIDEDLKKQIEKFYLEARIKTLETGIKHEVDHIIPLKGEVVCGLHVPWNLQVLTQFANRQKRNKLEISNV